MKIINGSADYTTPGLYWDGMTLWAVGSDGLGWSLGTNRSAFEYLEVDGGMSAQDAIGVIDAVERVLRTHDGRTD